MGLLTGYVKMLVKGVMLEMKHNKAIVDATIAPIKSNVSWLKRMTNWSSESLTTLSIKSGIDIPKKPE
jgi:hypothetical protein